MIDADYTNLQTPLRSIKGAVVLINGTTEPIIFNYTDNLKSFKIERIGESGKFFGFGVSQKLTVNLVDKDRKYSVKDGDLLMVGVTAYEEYEDITGISTFFYANSKETKRDENTNELTIVAYDKLADAANHTFSELELPTPYTMLDVAEACTNVLGLSLDSYSTKFNLEFADGANLEGTETIKDILDDIAEATQTIYYIFGNNGLRFKTLNEYTSLIITKEHYFDLEAGEPVTLAAIASVTELGDNVIANSSFTTGVTQYIRDNDFLALREDLADLLESGLSEVDGLTITPFSLSWRGNYYLEIGDKIEIEAKDGSFIVSYVLDDVIEYNGALKQKTQWKYEEAQTANNNPTTLGEALKQTYARVDKANKQIDLVVSETNANTEAIGVLQVNTESITGTVSSLQTTVDEATETVSTLSQKVEAQITDEQVSIKIKEELSNGVDKVVTGKGYSLTDEGFTIEDLSENNIQIKTTISNNGMAVSVDNEDVLVANDEGVKAVDLHATTFLIIGETSRLQDFNGRTACFWIGGNN